jgi:hypothetical protein
MKPEWYMSQELVCNSCLWRAGYKHIFRDNGKGGDGDMINTELPYFDKCPECGSSLSGCMGEIFLPDENPGVVYVADEVEI